MITSIRVSKVSSSLSTATSIVVIAPWIKGDTDATLSEFPMFTQLLWADGREREKKKQYSFYTWLENTSMIAPSGGQIRKQTPLRAVDEQLTLSAGVRVKTAHWRLSTVTYRISHRS